ncbi:MAG: hypothetical protein HPY62_13060 [Bacteroidales bacterium]|nr:hypothetical protein [Bacteroidales bacterium]
MKYLLSLFIISPLLFVSCSCNERGGKNISEGEIYYSIKFYGDIGSMPKEIRPKNLVVAFKDDKIIYELISPVGNSGIVNLTNPSKDIYDTYLSMFTIKYFYPSKPGEMHPGFEAMKDLEIKKTSKTSVICGYNCKHAEVKLSDNPDKIYDIWYTNEIDVNNPNASTPFHEIDGVLMSFFFIIGNSELHFDAESVYKKEIPDLTFERKQKFVRVSRADIKRFIDKMINL